MHKITNNFLNKLENTFKQKQFKEEKVHDVELQDCIVEGERHDKLVKIAGSLSRQAYSKSALKEALLSLNETLCENPLPEKEVEQIAKSIFKYANYKTNPDLQNDNGTVSKVISLLYSSNQYVHTYMFMGIKFIADFVSPLANPTPPTPKGEAGV